MPNKNLTRIWLSIYEWFKNTERSTVEPNMKTTKGALNIEIDENLLKHL